MRGAGARVLRRAARAPRGHQAGAVARERWHMVRDRFPAAARRRRGSVRARDQGAPALSVDEEELDRLAARLAAAGAPVTWDDRLPGVRRFYTADPFGNRLELLARIRASTGTSSPGEDAER